MLAVVGAVAVAAFVGVVRLDDGKEAWPEFRQTQGATVTHLAWAGAGVLVGGHRDGDPILVWVRGDRVSSMDVDGPGPVWSMVVGPLPAAVVDDGAGGERPVVLTYEFDYPDPWPLLSRADGRTPDHVWVTEEDEGWGQVGGFLEPSGRLGLTALDYQWGTFADTASLWLADDADAKDLFVVGTEGVYMVAGPVSNQPRAELGHDEIWVAGTYDPAFERLDVGIDLVTDVVSDGRNIVLAGKSAGRPVLIQWDHGDQRTLDLPSAPLGAEGSVLVAEPPVWQRNEERELELVRAPSVLLQDSSEAVLYVANGLMWDTYRVPGGEVTAVAVARTDDGRRLVFVVIDGRLRWGKLG